MAPARPFRGTVYLPGHDEAGHGVAVAKVSASTQANLDKALDRYRAEGYHVRTYEVLALPGLDNLDNPPEPSGTVDPAS